MNVSSHCDAISKYVGITQHKKNGKWIARIWHNKKNLYLGGFDSESNAATIRDEWAIKLRGEFARLNFNKTPLDKNTGK